MIRIRGMLGVGDCIHQRAILRDALKLDDEVVLETYYHAMYHDLISQGVRLRRIPGIKPRIRDRRQGELMPANRFTSSAPAYRVTYNRDMIHSYGNILASQYACLRMRMPARPDFSLPVPHAWRAAALELVGKHDRPIMVYRPSVLNNMWRSEARSPDSRVYAELFRSVRDRYHVVSVANLGDCGEHIDGEEMDADVKFHHDELGFEELAGLFAEASLAFTCPGFSPVLSQAVGTRTVIVYGGNESFRTTNSVGAHLAPTLAIEPIRPCACHLKTHDCDKTTDVPLAVERLEKFLCAA